MDQIRIIPHPESYEVAFPGDRESVYFHFEDEPTRRSLMGRMTRKQAEQAAKEFARGERDKAKTDTGS